MTLRYSEGVRNAALDARVAAIGPSPTLHLQGEDGEPLVSIVLPKMWMTKAANGLIQKAGDWQGVAHRTGKASSYRIIGANGNYVDGDIPADMKLDNPRFERGQVVVVGKYVISAGNTAKNG